jgi:glycogen debranching enzyme
VTVPDAPPVEGRSHQPWLHELSIIVNGNATVLSSQHGDIEPDTPQGLYVDDSRLLSGLEVALDGEAPAWVAAGASGPRAEFFASARNLGNPGPDPTVEVHRVRSLGRAGMVEEVSIVSRAAVTVAARVSVAVAADGAPIGAIKGGLVASSGVPPRLVDTALEFALPRHLLRLSFDPEPDEVELAETGAVAFFEATLEPGQTRHLRLVASAMRRAASALDAEPGADAVSWSDIRVQADDPRVAMLFEQSLDDLRHLLLRDPIDPADVFAAAGTPWYLTLFGRDSIWTARMMLPFGTELAGGTLRALARRQGTADRDDRSEQPGKIAHEVRRTAYANPTSGLSLAPLYFGTVDATPLWVTLLVDAWRWGLPEPEARALLPNLRAALGWINGPAQPDQDGFLKYLDTTGTGLTNQGWKDYWDAVRWRDGRVAEAPIALVEAQAYAVEALAGAGDLLDALGEEGGEEARSQAAAMRERIEAAFWVTTDAGSYLALALDRAGAPVDGLASNMGHVLGTGTLARAEAARVAETMMGDELLDRFGVRTMGSRNGGFNPIGYHTGSVWTHDTAIAALGLAREGFGAEASRLAMSLVDAAESFDYRLPELYSGIPMMGRPAPYPASCRPQAWSAASVGALVTVALGLRADVPRGVLQVAPLRPGPFGALRVEGIRLSGALLTIEANRDGEVSVEGLPAGIEVRPSA